MGLPNDEQRKHFQLIFKAPLNMFFDPFVPELGFDIVKFDDFMKKRNKYDEDANGGTSLSDFILAKYGQGAVDLITQLNKA